MYLLFIYLRIQFSIFNIQEIYTCMDSMDGESVKVAATTAISFYPIMNRYPR